MYFKSNSLIMKQRVYAQYCAIARSLDVIGERWTLLIVRELLTGPKRFKSLQQNLPGIGTNLLTTRLKHLEEHQIVQKIKLPPPASVNAYDLTDFGHGLETVLISIIKWGGGYLAKGQGDDYARSGWAILGIRGLFQPKKAEGVELTCQFLIDDEAFWISINQGKIMTLEGQIGTPDITLIMKGETFLGLGDGSTDIFKSLQNGDIKLEGPTEILETMFSTLIPS